MDICNSASGTADETAENLNSDQNQQINVIYDLFQLSGRLLFPSAEPPPSVGLQWDYKVSCGRVWNWSPSTLTLATEETRLTLNLWDEVWRKKSADIAQFRDGFLIESVGVSHLTIAHIHLFVGG